MERISKRQYYLDIAFAVSKRSNCIKRHYGCIIVKNDEIIATGYNGSARGEMNCCDLGFCKRIDKPHNSGDYSDCPAVHAEQNAMISASRKDMIGATMYLSCEEEQEFELTPSTPGYKQKFWNRVWDISPCPICERMIRNSGIKEVIVKE